MRTVYNSAVDVIHIFAQQSQNHGKSSNVFFYDKKIYSYGYHYLLAEFISDNVIIINDKGYSATTAKHIRYITQATRQYTQYFVSEICSKQVYFQLFELKNKLLKAKKPEVYLLQAQRLLGKYKDFQTFAGEKRYNSLLNYTYIDKIEELSNEFNSIVDSDSIKELQMIEKEKMIEKERKAIESFLNFDTNFIRLDFDVLRINEQNIETSQGVKISIEQGLKLAQLLKTGECLDNRHFLNYTIHDHKKNSIKIGCHNFKIDYLLKFANDLIN